MKRYLVISDIHGTYTAFLQLLEKMNYSEETDQLILLGDYIDRGQESKEVLDQVIALQKEGAIVLRGNHDQMMLDAYEGKQAALDRWLRNGGKQTMASYGSKDWELVKENPDFLRHLNFIRGLAYYHETEDYIFVHAGVLPDQDPAHTDPEILLWIREEFYLNYQGEKLVVFGHTPTKYLHKDGSNQVFFGENPIIGIDGAAVYGGQLNGIELPSRKTYAVKARNKG